jgi:hypothetical protein
VILAGVKSKKIGGSGRALDDDKRALVDALGQLRNGLSARAKHNDVGGGRGLGLESYGGQNLRPGAGVISEYGEANCRRRGGGGGDCTGG